MGLTSSRSRLSALYQVSQKYHKELFSTATFGLESWTGLLKKEWRRQMQFPLRDGGSDDARMSSSKAPQGISPFFCYCEGVCGRYRARLIPNFRAEASAGWRFCDNFWGKRGSNDTITSSRGAVYCFDQLVLTVL